MKHVVTTAFAAACSAALCFATPAKADIKSGELERAYNKGKKKSFFGKATMRDELTCFFLYSVWSNVNATYHMNLAIADGELAYGFTQIQFNHYALRWSHHSQNSPGFKEAFLSVLDQYENLNFEKEKNQKLLGRLMGQCMVPLGRISIAANDLGRADTFLMRVASQPFKNEYPPYIKNRQAWDAHAAAWRKGDVVEATQIILRSMDGGDTKTFHENEYLVAVKAVTQNGMADKLPTSAYTRAAYMEPETFASLAGYDPADFRPQIVPYKASSSRLGSMAAGTAARNTAESLARDKCERAGGKVFRVNSVPTESYKATETSWRTTYEATAQCQFPPKLGG